MSGKTKAGAAVARLKSYSPEWMRAGEEGAIEAMTEEPGRAVSSSANALFEIVLLSNDDLGTTGSLIRDALLSMLGGSITEADVASYVTYAGRKTYLSYCRQEGIEPSAKTPVDDAQDDYVRGQLEEMVSAMEASRRLSPWKSGLDQ